MKQGVMEHGVMDHGAMGQRVIKLSALIPTTGEFGQIVRADLAERVVVLIEINEPRL